MYNTNIKPPLSSKFRTIYNKAVFAAEKAMLHANAALAAETLAIQAKTDALKKSPGFTVTEFKCGYIGNTLYNWMYYGQWGKNTPHGYGVLDASASKHGYYAGQFRHGYFQGDGVYYFDLASNSLKYSGSFWKDLWHGHGVYEWKNGSVFKGETKQQELKGYGILTKPENYIFEGYKGNMKKYSHGQHLNDKSGIEYNGNADKYRIGHWIDNVYYPEET